MPVLGYEGMKQRIREVHARVGRPVTYAGRMALVHQYATSLWEERATREQTIFPVEDDTPPYTEQYTYETIQADPYYDTVINAEGLEEQVLVTPEPEIITHVIYQYSPYESNASYNLLALTLETAVNEVEKEIYGG